MASAPVDPEQKKEKTNPWAIALGAGSELVAAVLAGYFIGAWLDKKLATGTWLTLSGTLAGISLGLYQLIRATSIRSDRR